MWGGEVLEIFCKQKSTLKRISHFVLLAGSGDNWVLRGESSCYDNESHSRGKNPGPSPPGGGLVRGCSEAPPPCGGLVRGRGGAPPPVVGM